MKKLVFVCRGNMFRSQLAEAIFNSDPVPGWHAVSYGVSVIDEGLQGVKLSDYGKGIEFEIEEMKKRGVDIAEKTCQQLLPDYLDDADKVIVMSEIEYTPDWLLKRNDERWEVLNPDVVTQEIAKDTITLLSEKINVLKKALTD